MHARMRSCGACASRAKRMQCLRAWCVATAWLHRGACAFAAVMCPCVHACSFGADAAQAVVQQRLCSLLLLPFLRNMCVLLHGRTRCRLGCCRESLWAFPVTLLFLHDACVSLRDLRDARIRCLAVAGRNISLQHHRTLFLPLALLSCCCVPLLPV